VLAVHGRLRISQNFHLPNEPPHGRTTAAGRLSISKTSARPFAPRSSPIRKCWPRIPISTAFHLYAGGQDRPKDPYDEPAAILYRPQHHWRPEKNANLRHDRQGAYRRYRGSPPVARFNVHTSRIKPHDFVSLCSSFGFVVTSKYGGASPFKIPTSSFADVNPAGRYQDREKGCHQHDLGASKSPRQRPRAAVHRQTADVGSRR